VTLELIDEAVSAGARQHKACEAVGISPRTIQRWRRGGGGEDQRHGPRQRPKSALTEQERRKVLQTVNSVENRDLSPKQIVPKLAEKGEYIASESSIYRILRQEKQLTHHQRSQPPQKRAKPRLVAHSPNEVWTWDITYLRTTVRGVFLYLYLIMDMWSRKIVGWTVEECESKELSAILLERSCQELGVDPRELTLHADNGGPMKGSTMLATMQRLGVVPSFSRPHVSDDNPYSESLFRTLKYRPEYPSKPFGSLEEARDWVAAFIAWYNTEHLHSSIRFVTPDDRHFGREYEILARRRATYEQARRRHPERWSGATRNWSPVGAVSLNPITEEVLLLEEKAA
jgi:putative transposase